MLCPAVVAALYRACQVIYSARRPHPCDPPCPCLAPILVLQGKPGFVSGNTEAQPILPVDGEVFVLRKLLPPTADYDFNIHVMDFKPGEGWGLVALGESWTSSQVRSGAQQLWGRAHGLVLVLVGNACSCAAALSLP